jgi:hypothetical protein
MVRSNPHFLLTIIKTHTMYSETQQQEIDNAREVLKKYGYYVTHLWHIDDVKFKHECSDEEAYEILENALKNEATYEQIWMGIDYAIEYKITK